MKKIAIAAGTAMGVATLAAGVVGTADAAPARANGGVAHSQPWHDPHCTRDGHWHLGPGDPDGRPDPRCPRW